MLNIDGKNGKTIEAGKGKVAIDENVLRIAKGKTLMLDLSAESRPCTDDYCKVIMNLSLKILSSPPGPNVRVFPLENCVVAMTDAVYRSIDRGRERVTISKGISGNLITKGFSLTT
ncbi:MAG: hypothetical protein ACP5UZ_05850 [Thermoplasmata archaeon]